jgi:predicted CXXCH cytochrome family protein
MANLFPQKAVTGEGDNKMRLEKGKLRGRVKIRHLIILAVGGAFWLGLSATSAVADAGPHVLGTGGVVADGCAGCHRVHTASGAKLIKSAQPALCYTCHDGTGATTDVVDGLGYTGVGKQGTPGALRGGGFTYALVNSTSPTGQSSAMSNPNGVVPVLATGAATTSSHDVSGALSTVWGSGGINAAAVTTPLTCGSCHDPHGNGNYRILKGLPVGAATGAVAVNITEPVSVTKTYTTTNYWQVADPNTAGYIANISAWCTTCHTRYMGGTGSGSTSSGDAVYSYRHTSNGTTQGSASCIQCHVAHGSNASVSGTYSSGVKFPDGTGTTTDGRLLRIDNRGTCQMCHNR